MDKNNTNRKHDIALFVVLIVAGVILFAVIDFMKAEGASVDVHVDGKVVASYPLSTDREVELGYNGHNSLVIKEGQAKVTGADCPDKLCVKQKAISREGETIVCLPHRLVVKISGGEGSGVDGVVR
ncbi:MAG: NusG domain II-containing protein [Clostridiales Family XIII bacterium]|jgi:hypothetical protein|nr:NusG domain II-containing protein [Clostridiales Family XIII bacterium]